MGGKISKLGVKRICTSARAFFNWLKIHSRAYAGLEANWIDTLYPPRMGDEPRKERDAVTLEMVRTLREVPDNGNLKTRRDKAAAAFLFLTGMRATAFVTMPINCFDLAKRMVKQYPALGVRTKNRKAILTRLLEVPDLLAVVGEWDSYVRANLPDTAPWYAPTVGEPGRVVNSRPGENRGDQLSKRLRELFIMAGLKPMSAHKFRHGAAVYGLKQARTMEDFKAVSMNLGHSTIGITDGIYAILSDEDMSARIAALGNGGSTAGSAAQPAQLQDVAALVAETLQRMGITAEMLQRAAGPAPAPAEKIRRKR